MNVAKARKKKTPAKKNKKTQQTNMGQILLFVCFIVLSIIAICRFGIVGQTLYNIVCFVFGTLSIPLLILFIFICGWAIFKDIKDLFENQYWIGILCILCATSLLLGLIEFKGNNATHGLNVVLSQFVDILKGDAKTLSGLFGSLLLALFVSLLDFNGSYFIVVVLYLIGIGFLSIRWIREYLEQPKQKPVKIKPVIKKEEPVKKKETSIFLDYDKK